MLVPVTAATLADMTRTRMRVNVHVGILTTRKLRRPATNPYTSLDRQAGSGPVQSCIRNRRLRNAAIAGITAGVLSAVSSLVSGTLGPAVAVLGAIPPAVIVGVFVYVALPLLGSRRPQDFGT